MLSATLSARSYDSCHRIVLTLTAPPADGGTLAILSLDLRDSLAPAKAAAFVETAESYLADGTLDVLHVSADGARTLAETLGV